MSAGRPSAEPRRRGGMMPRCRADHARARCPLRVDASCTATSRTSARYLPQRPRCLPRAEDTDLIILYQPHQTIKARAFSRQSPCRETTGGRLPQVLQEGRCRNPRPWACPRSSRIRWNNYSIPCHDELELPDSVAVSLPNRVCGRWSPATAAGSAAVPPGGSSVQARETRRPAG